MTARASLYHHDSRMHDLIPALGLRKPIVFRFVRICSQVRNQIVGQWVRSALILVGQRQRHRRSGPASAAGDRAIGHQAEASLLRREPNPSMPIASWPAPFGAAAAVLHPRRAMSSFVSTDVISRHCDGDVGGSGVMPARIRQRLYTGLRPEQIARCMEWVVEATRWSMARCAGVLLAVSLAWASLSPAVVAHAQAPLVLNTIVEEANEALFDGEYGETIRLTAKALEILKSPAKRRNLKQLGGDWLLAEGMLQGLQAEALLLTGSEALAGSRLEAAARKAESRRTYYVRSGADPSIYFLYAAHLEFLEGDLAYRPPTYGLHARDDVPELSIDDSGASTVRARRHYEEAAEILERLLKLDPTPSDNVVQGPRLIAQRLMLRLAVNMARAEFAVRPEAERLEGYPDCLKQPVIDAEALVTRAQDVLNNNQIYRDYLRPTGVAGSRRLSYREFQEYQDRKSKQSSTASVTEQELIELKQLWHHAISDFVLVNNLRAEIEVIKEMVGAGEQRQSSAGAFDPSIAELLYMGTKQFLQEQFRPSHPILSDVEVSMLRWFNLKSNLTARDREQMTPYLARQKISYAQDALFYASKIRAAAESDKSPMRTSRVRELRCLEASAIRNLLDIHDTSPFLDDESRKRLVDRDKAILVDIQRDEARTVAEVP
jgi:hypothetical protein